MGLLSKQIADFVKTIRNLRASNKSLTDRAVDLIQRVIVLQVENRALLHCRPRPGNIHKYDVFVGS